MFENPFGTNLQDLQQNYYQQLAAMQQMQQKQDLLENDPELKKRYEELSIGK